MVDEQADDGTCYAFSILDNNSQYFYRASFSLDPETRNLTVTVNPDDDLSNPESDSI